MYEKKKKNICLEDLANPDFYIDETTAIPLGALSRQTRTATLEARKKEMERAEKNKLNCQVLGVHHWNIKFGSSLNFRNNKRICIWEKLLEGKYNAEILQDH